LQWHPDDLVSRFTLVNLPAHEMGCESAPADVVPRFWGLACWPRDGRGMADAEGRCRRAASTLGLRGAENGRQREERRSRRDIQPASLRTAEEEQLPTQGIRPQVPGDQGAQPVEALPEIGRLPIRMHPDPAGAADHVSARIRTRRLGRSRPSMRRPFGIVTTGPVVGAGVVGNGATSTDRKPGGRPASSHRAA
jgi:hypothetical protein